MFGWPLPRQRVEPPHDRYTGAAMTHFIEIQGAEMVFSTRKGRFHALREIDLDVAKGEFVTLIGHSGCGKSTLLNLVAGLTRPTQGLLLLEWMLMAVAKRFDYS